MTRENVKKNIDIISAFAEGKVIQILNEREEWVDLTEREGLPIGTLEESPNIFRIKPELKYRPFKDAKECWKEMPKHKPFGWLKSKEATKDIYFTITGLTNVIHGVILNSTGGWSFSGLFDYYTFADGTPFGAKEEE